MPFDPAFSKKVCSYLFENMIDNYIGAFFLSSVAGTIPAPSNIPIT